ncbi:hypothetical protein Micbo1qcDRAFT_195137 [Microdochium bolleyi]|uniref:Carrier domain-containing protein n=1 Tax=Microdochium bolleyi TaxID=196109 RepID=A0A136J4Z0_9PEZI|nr:hypothetical protein Micbo1qcDRAFT_195137 [Microdochium bolleyi]
MATAAVQSPVDARDVFSRSVAAAPPGDVSAESASVTPSDEDILRDIASVCGVPVAAIEDLYPCTPLQVGIIAQPIERIYINCIYATLAPSLDLNRFCDAIRHVYALNSVLRTRIVDSELGLVQVVLKEELTIAQPPATTQDNKDELQATLWREKSTPMRLGQPLFRAAVVGRTIVLTTHHAIADGGTYHSLFDNLSRAYHGQALAPHAEFRLFVKHCCSIEDAAARAFWGPRFSGHPVAFPIMDIDVMPDARAKIKTTVSLASIPLHDVPVGLMSSYVETAWAVTAMSYTNAESIVFGRVLSARAASLGGFESTLGPTIVTMPVQVNLSQTATIGALIRERAQERREALNSPALQYGLVGLRTVNDAAKRAARFTTLINFRTPTDQGTDYISTELDIHGEYEPHLPYGLGISLVWNGKGLNMETLHDPDIVCERQTRRLLRQFEHVLGLLLQMPAGTRLGALTLLNAHDRREMIGWNRLSIEPADHTLHQLFRARSRLQPDAPAVRGPEGNLTYAALDRKSDAVAHGLRSKGVGKEDAVVLVFDKSVWTIVAQLGVLKAGAVCVPIDPAFPAARKKTILSGSGAAMVLTGAPFHELPSEWTGTVWVLGGDDEQLDINEAAKGNHDAGDNNNNNNNNNSNDGVSASQAAFILFTSGSTGAPKGHILEHRNLVSSLTAIGRAMSLDQNTRMLQFAAYVWDMSIAEMHGTLLAGGCVCVPSDEARESAVAAYIAADQVNTAIFTPTVLRLLAPHEAPLATIMSIGEPVDLESADAWTAAGCRFFNAWGPSETACVSAMAELTPESSYRGNIGRPLASAIWLVDPRDADAGRLVPVGAVGEIVVEGRGVARGYLNAPQQTAAAFIDPPSWAPSRRGSAKKMYRTGDLARYNPDGSLQYVGRQDNQVKVNGQRVELGEVEKALGSYEGVRQALCVAQALRGQGSRKSLVAVVVLDSPRLQAPQALRELSAEHEPQVSHTLETLRELLSTRLPSYMVPSVWKVVEDFPRTTSLKIDRSAIKKWLLAELTAGGDSGGAEGADADKLTEPVSPTEVCLRAAWADALGLLEAEVGRESSFIRLGGDSILAIKVATLCRKQGLRVSVATLLRSRSLAEVAENTAPIEADPRSGNKEARVTKVNGVNGLSATGSDEVSELARWDPADMPMMQSLLEDLGLDASDVEAVMPCSPLQQDITLSQAKDNGSEYWMRLTMKLSSTTSGEVVDEARLVQSWKAVCSAQPILRTIIVSYEGRDSAFQQIILKDAPTSVSSAKLGQSQEPADIGPALAAIQPPNLIARKSQHHLHISSTTAGPVYVIVFINHALFDERSVHLLANQLSSAYRDAASLSRGRSLAAYLDRVEQSRDATQDHWRKYLAGAEPCNIPELTRAESKLTQPVGSVICDVPIADVQRITAFCGTHGVTLANLMQLAWAVVLQICTGSDSPVFGYLHSHSGLVEGGDSIMGPLLSMAYWRLRGGPDTPVDQLLKMANKDSLQALECGACSVSQLYEDLGLGSAALFNTVMTIYRLSPRDTVAVRDRSGGLDIEHMPLGGHNEYLMTLGVAYDNNAIHSGILFDPARAAPSFVSKIAVLLSTVLDGIVGNSQQTLQSLEATVLPGDLTLFSPRDDISRAVRRKAAAHCEVGPTQVESVYPCTALQCQQVEAAVASTQSDLDQYIFHCNGSSVSAADVQAAWERVVAAYPILRSRIVSLGDHGTCCVTLRSGAGILADSEGSLADYLTLDGDKPVRYGRPLCRLGVVDEQQAGGPVSAVLSIHRTIYDPWTISVIERALARACAGEDIAPVQPCDSSLVGGHRACRAAATAARSRPVSNPVVHNSEAPRFPRAQAGTAVLSGSHLSQVEGVFETEILHAAWVLTLSRVTASSSVSVGVHVDGRGARVGDTMPPEMLEVPGPVGAVHPFSVDVSSTPTVAALLGSIRSWEAEISAEPSSVETRSRPHQTPAAVAAANVLVVDQSPRLLLQPPRQGQPAVTRSRAHMSPTPTSDGVLMVLRCTTVADSDKVEMDVRFDKRAVAPEAVGMLVAQYQHAIRQLTSSSSSATILADLPVLSSHETTLLRQWAQELPPTAAEGDGDCYYIHDQIKQQATTQSGGPAVCSWDGDLTHGELDDLSDRLAAFLLARYGVGPGVVVPYFLDKSVVAVVVMLGILKAGGALLPLDSNHPAERLQGIIAESGASVVLVVSALHGKVAGKLDSSSSSQELVEVNMALVHSLARETPRPAAPISPSDLCYIIYTSGSSGKPKGVMVTHGNMTTSATARRELVGMGPRTRTLQYLNFIFDVAMFDVFLTLAAGGCVCLPSEAEWSSDVAGAVRRTRANFVFLTPSLATLLRPGECPTLDTLALTGEPCEAGVVERWRDRRVLNMYGPAEATVHSSGADVSHGSGRHHLDIGRGGGCVYWAVDPERCDRLVPIGCPGELVIYGPIVARGYLGDPGRTAAAFIGPPAWAEAMGLPSGGGSYRWYKTGDLVVQSPDGSMVYQGRKDTQVKLSGQRIELGEIEHHLLLRPSGSRWHVAVELVAPAGLDQDKALVVFFADGADDAGQENQQQQLLLPPLRDEAVAFRDSLTASVPPYMVPQFYVRLCKLPMTSSGKLDRAALRRLGGSLSPAELGRYSTSGAGTSPPTPPLSTDGRDGSDGGDGASKNSSSHQQQLEARLGQLWSEVLGIPQETIRPEDNFFSLGGSSIRATRLAHGARRAGIELGVPLVFEHPTLGQMASAASWRGNGNGNGSDDGVDRNGPDQAAALASRLTKLMLADGDFRRSWEAQAARRPGLGGLSAGSIASVAVATDVQADMVAVGELDGQAWHNSMTVEAAATAGGLEVAALQRACAAVMARHELLRTTFVQHRDRLYQVVLRPDAAEAAAASGSSDLARFHLQQLSGDAGSGQQRCARLVLEVHHAHYDAIAMDMVLADLRAAYCHYTSPSTTTTAWTPPPAPRFDALVAHVGALDPAPARRFWTAALAGSAMTRLVPTPPGAPATPYPCVDTVRVRVPMACVDVNVDVGSTGRSTPSSVVQAAWALLLARATGRRDVVFCAPHANRDVPGFADADRVPGLCLNFLPARARLASGNASGYASGNAPGDGPGEAATLGALIHQMHAAAVAAIPHRHLGFRTVVRECTPWPARTRYGSMLIYQNHDALRRAIRFGDRDCLLTPRGNFGRCADLLVEATPDEDVNGDSRDLVVDLLFSRRSFTDAQVDWIARTLEAILLAVPTSLDVPIDQVGCSPGDTLPYPVSLHGIGASASASSNGHGQGNGNRNADGNGHANGDGHVHDLVLQAWSRVGLMANKTVDTSHADLLRDGGDCSMYNDVDASGSGVGGGDLVTTLLLAREYQRSGHQVTMQQLIDNPTMRAQSGLITSAL